MLFMLNAPKDMADLNVESEPPAAGCIVDDVMFPGLRRTG